MFPVLQIDSLPFEPPGKPIKRNKIREIDGTEQRATNFQQSGKVTQQIRKVFSNNCILICKKILTSNPIFHNLKTLT